MNRSERSCPPRLAAVVLLGGDLSLLALAAYVTPSPSGFGSHVQLGLPPCLFHKLVGVPCALCGATTAFALTVRGQLAQAFATHAVAALLCMLCAAAVPLLVVCVARPAWLPITLWHTRSRVSLHALTLSFMVHWLVRLWTSSWA